jgi:hypothetical protein
LFKLCKKNRKKSQFSWKKQQNSSPPKKKQELVLFYFILKLFVAFMGLQRVINKPTNFCNTFFFWFFFGGNFFMCLLLLFLVSKFGDETSLTRTRNEPSKLFSLPQRKKETKEWTVSTWWHRKQFYFFIFYFLVCVMVHDCLREGRRELTLWSLSKACTRTQVCMCTHIHNKSRIPNSIVSNPNSILRLFQRPHYPLQNKDHWWGHRPLPRYIYFIYHSPLYLTFYSW